MSEGPEVKAAPGGGLGREAGVDRGPDADASLRRRLAGRAAIVTGAGHGIGRAVALRLAAEGARVTVAGLDRAAGERTAADIRATGGEALNLPTDIADPAAIDRLAAGALERWGAIDLLVNNAAREQPIKSVLDVSLEEWEHTLWVNLTGPFLLTQACARHMAARGRGCIVNLLAIQTEVPLPGYATYVSGKGGFEALTRCLAVELGPLGIRVNAVQPGAVATASFQRQLPYQEQRAAVGEGHEPVAAALDQAAPTLIRRMGRGEDIAGVVAFLVSDDAAFLQGAIVRADGGRLLSRRPDPLLQDGPG